MEDKYEVVFISDEQDDYILFSSKYAYWIGERSENEGYFNQELTFKEIIELNPAFIPFLKVIKNV